MMRINRNDMEMFAGFLAEIEAVCRKNQFVLAHEDYQGSFLIEPFSEEAMEHLKTAYADSDSPAWQPREITITKRR